jgi:hypothetical protein
MHSSEEPGGQASCWSLPECLGTCRPFLTLHRSWDADVSPVSKRGRRFFPNTSSNSFADRAVFWYA